MHQTLTQKRVERPLPTMNTLGQRETWVTAGCLYGHEFWIRTPPTLGAPNALFIFHFYRPPTRSKKKINERYHRAKWNGEEWLSEVHQSCLETDLFYTTQNLAEYTVPLYLSIMITVTIYTASRDEVIYPLIGDLLINQLLFGE